MTDKNTCLDRYAGTEEAAVARRLVRAALTSEWTVSVNDGEEWTVKRSTDFNEIIDALATTGADSLQISDKEGKKMGSLYLVYQNGPGDELIADYSDNESMEYLYRRANPA